MNWTNKKYHYKIINEKNELIAHIHGFLSEAEKFVEDPVFGGADFITREKQNQPRTKAEAMDKFRENLLEQEIDYPEKTFDQQRSGAMEKGISPTDRSLIPSDFLIKPGEAAAQKPFVDIAKDIDREYDLAEGGLAGLARQEMFLGGIAKSLKKITKKATRAVKKIAKSDFARKHFLSQNIIIDDTCRCISSCSF